MPDDVFQQPTHEQLKLFVTGDPIAINEVVHLVLPQMRRWAWKQYSNLPSDEVESTVHQVLAETCVNHSRYNPEASQITTYLTNLLKLRLIDLYNQENEIKKFEDSGPEAQEKLIRLTYNPLDTPDIAIRMTRDQFFDIASGRLTDEELAFLQLIKQGEKQQEIFEAVLRSYRSMIEPGKETKNLKARVMRKLRIIAEEHGFRYDDLIGQH